ncbi:hypothetical protein ES332_A07G187500v1 [Gossypium tomentosum]|uniref:Carboxypeptidase n=1 Tax=Gossypium tomentosum TaxID=34277 RepID=A0A5D2PUR4_GOSTO|nr:hypothetical protein ES332_A07G187500v1 [Gossypium tomentosum]
MCLKVKLIECSALEDALITHLPGFFGIFLSNHSSGYVNIDKSNGKNLFYCFVESERKPSEDPVVLWLNGGPRCSALMYNDLHGTFTVSMFHVIFYMTMMNAEMNAGGTLFFSVGGPFNFEEAKTEGSMPYLHINPYSWSKMIDLFILISPIFRGSNIIYLDSPVGVGLSYSKNQSDCVTGDLQTVANTHAFLLKWFELYPKFLSNMLFIAGESYAGIYVPTLSYEVGYLVGNGFTNVEFDGNSFVPFAYGMDLISDYLYEEVTNECMGNFYNPHNDTCETKLEKVDEVKPCYHDPDAAETKDVKIRLLSSFWKLGETDKPLAVLKRMFGRAWPFRAPVRDGIVLTWPELLNRQSVPCTNDEVATAWLNDGAVRKAIHAEGYHKNLTSRGYWALIFNEDDDMCVPFTGSEAWTRSIGYKIVDEWRPWIYNGQVAGYLQGYENNLTFLTIKGAGHTLPDYKPQEALYFYTGFLAEKSIWACFIFFIQV